MSRVQSHFGSTFPRLRSTLVTQALLFLLAFFCLAPSRAQTANFISPQAIGSGFSTPEATAVDAAGDVFVADCSAAAIYEIVAVNGAVSAGSKINTIQRNIGHLYGIALDKSGDLFFSGSVSGKVGVYEVVASSGVLSSSTTPILIDSFSAPQGITVDASGDLFVAAWTAGVYEIPATSGAVVALTTPVAVGSGFSAVTGVAVDASGDVFVADYSGGYVYEIVASGGVVSSSSTVNRVAGHGGSNIFDVAVDGLGDVFVSDASSKDLYEVVAVSGVVSSTSPVNTLYTASVATQGIALDANGNIFLAVNGAGVNLADSAVYEISTRSFNFGSVKVGSSTTQTLTFTITSGGTLGTPQALTQGAPNLDFTDAGTGTCTTTPTQSTGSTCTVVVKFAPMYAGARVGAVNLVNTSGAVIATAYLYGTGTGPQAAFSPGLTSQPIPNTTTFGGSVLNNPFGIAVDGAGDLYVSDNGNSRVVEMTASGVTSVVNLGSYTLRSPFYLAVDGAGDLYIADSDGGRVLEVTAAGVASVLSTGSYTLSGPEGVAVDSAGNVYITDSDNNRVLEVTASGNASVLIDSSTQIGGSSLNSPEALAVDAAGNLYIADTDNNRIVKLTAAGVASVLNTGSTTVTSPWGLAVDAAGNVYISQTDLADILVVTPAGAVSTLNVMSVGSSDSPSMPSGLAVDGAGSVYIVDGQYAYVDKVAQGTPAAIGFPNTVPGTSSSTSSSMGLTNVTLQNIGNETLNLTGLVVATTGISPSIFTLDSATSCTRSTTLDSDASCAIAIDFSPTAEQSYTGSVTLTDNSLNTTGTQQTVALSGNGAGLVLVPSSTQLPDATYGAAYSQTFTASAGTAPYTYTTKSTLPAGLTLSSSGVLSGTLTAAGSYSIRIKATDSSSTPQTESRTYSLNVDLATPTVTVSNASITTGAATATLSASIAYTGAAAPTGAVSITVDSGAGVTASCTGSASPLTCTASYTTSSLSVGSHTIKAGIAADANYSAASNTGTLTVTTAMPTVTVSNATAAYGATSTTLTAAIAYTGAAAPTGAVSFTVDSGAAAAANCTGSASPLTCTASYTTSSLSVGSHTIKAGIAADANYSAASGTGTLAVAEVVQTLSSLSPAFTDAGGAGFTLTLTGSGFTATSTAYWGTTALTTTYVSATKLTAAVPASLIVTEGAYNLSVQSANETTSNTMSFQVDTASSSTYAPTLTTITATVTAGSSANYPVTLPSGVSQVTVACLNLPTGASCSYSNGAVTITTSSTTPKGTYTVTVVFTETATVTGTALILAPFLLLPLWFLRKKLKVQGAWITACMAVAILAGTLLATTGCGGSSSKQTSPVTSSSVVTLTVQ